MKTNPLNRMPDIASRPESDAWPSRPEDQFTDIRGADAQETVAKGATPRAVFRGFRKILIPLIGAVVLLVFFAPDSLYIKQEKLEEVDVEKQAASSQALLDNMNLMAERERRIRERELRLERTPAPEALQAPAQGQLQPVANAAASVDTRPRVSDEEMRLMVMIRGAPLEPQGRFQLTEDERPAGGTTQHSTGEQTQAPDLQKEEIEERARQQIALVRQKEGAVASSGGLAGAGGERQKSNDSLVRNLQRGTAEVISYQQSESAQTLLTQNTIVRAVLLSGINSDLPGSIAARVTSDIYDSLTGRHVLIPKGSMLTGAYGSDVTVGQERVFVAMQRLILPDGTWVSLVGDTGADMQGNAGLSAHVNNHFWKMFSTSAIIGFSSFLLPKEDRQVTVTTGDASNQSGGSIMGMAMRDTITTLLERNKNIPPTLTVKPGSPYILMLSKDLVMRPYVPQRR